MKILLIDIVLWILDTGWELIRSFILLVGLATIINYIFFIIKNLSNKEVDIYDEKYNYPIDRYYPWVDDNEYPTGFFSDRDHGPGQNNKILIENTRDKVKQDNSIIGRNKLKYGNKRSGKIELNIYG